MCLDHAYILTYEHVYTISLLLLTGNISYLIIDFLYGRVVNKSKRQLAITELGKRQFYSTKVHERATIKKGNQLDISKYL